MIKCGKAMRCWDNSVRYCVCELGHSGGCNPFSANPNLKHVGMSEIKKETRQEDILDLFKKVKTAARLEQ